MVGKIVDGYCRVLCWCILYNVSQIFLKKWASADFLRQTAQLRSALLVIIGEEYRHLMFSCSLTNRRLDIARRPCTDWFMCSQLSIMVTRKSLLTLVTFALSDTSVLVAVCSPLTLSTLSLCGVVSPRCPVIYVIMFYAIVACSSDLDTFFIIQCYNQLGLCHGGCVMSSVGSLHIGNLWAVLIEIIWLY